MKQCYFLLLGLLFFSCENQKGSATSEKSAPFKDGIIDSKGFDSLLNANTSRLLWSNLWEAMNKKEFDFALNRLKEEKIIATRSEYLCGYLSIIDRDMYDFSSNNKAISFVFKESFIENKLGSIELIFTSITHPDAPQICTVVQDEIDTMISLLSNKYGEPTISELDSSDLGKSYEWKQEGRIIILTQRRKSAKRIELKNVNPKKLPEFASITYKFKKTLQMKKSKQEKVDSLQKIQTKKAMERL
ncbi:MAG: hypothetical protein ACI9L9_001269 [Marivirga sp.]|jgi:hypothetical protein